MKNPNIIRKIVVCILAFSLITSNIQVNFFAEPEAGLYSVETQQDGEYVQTELDYQPYTPGQENETEENQLQPQPSEPEQPFPTPTTPPPGQEYAFIDFVFENKELSLLYGTNGEAILALLPENVQAQAQSPFGGIEIIDIQFLHIVLSKLRRCVTRL